MSSVIFKPTTSRPFQNLPCVHRTPGSTSQPVRPPNACRAQCHRQANLPLHRKQVRKPNTSMFCKAQSFLPSRFPEILVTRRATMRTLPDSRAFVVFLRGRCVHHFHPLLASIVASCCKAVGLRSSFQRRTSYCICHSKHMRFSPCCTKTKPARYRTLFRPAATIP